MDIGREIFNKMKEALDLNSQLYVVDRSKSDPFEKLVAIILSQNTNDKNSIRALENLKREIGLKPINIIKAGKKKVEEAIKVSGLYKQKADRLIILSKKVLGGLNLKEIINLPVEEARRELMKIPGIGPKTADVLLSIYGKETIGIDTHLARVSKRLGLVPEKANYEIIRKELMKIFKGLNYDLVHRYMIALGRTWCNAKNPKCEECPLRSLCEYYNKK